MSKSKSPVGTQSLGAACRTAEAIKRQWRGGAPANAAAALLEHPSLCEIRSIVVDLAYEEYVIKELAGEQTDISEFVLGFPTHQASIAEVLNTHRLLIERSELLAREPSAWPEIGDQCEGLELVGLVGRGAFGRAYLAYDPGTSRTCVLKLAEGRSTEAQKVGQLRHPHITDVYWSKCVGMWTAVCMPLVGITTLDDIRCTVFSESEVYPQDSDQIIQAIHPIENECGGSPNGRGIVPLGRGCAIGVAAIGARIADALAHAHRNGIIHGDLKPSNVILGPGGHPYLIDFNLASALSGSTLRACGTLPYMAPEVLAAVQAGQHVETAAPHKVDLYALGVMMFELLTGAVPFKPDPVVPDQTQSLLAQVHASTPKLKANSLLIPQALAEVVLSCLAPLAQDRPVDAARVSIDLQKIVDDDLRSEHRKLVHRRRLLTGLFAVSLAAACAWLGNRYLSVDATVLSTPNHGGDLPTTAAYLNRGVRYLHDEQYTLALIDFGKADPHRLNPVVLAYSAYAHVRAGHPREATLLGLEAIKRGDNTVAVRNNLGYAHLQVGEADKAVFYLDDALRLDPKSKTARYNRAMARLRLYSDAQGVVGDRRAADDIAVLLADGVPSSAELYFNAGMVYARSTGADPSFRAEAIRLLTEAVRLGKDPSACAKDWNLQRALGDTPEFQLLCQSTPQPSHSQLSRILPRVIEPSHSSEPD